MFERGVRRAASVGRAPGRSASSGGSATSRSATRSATPPNGRGPPPFRAADPGDGRRAPPAGRQGRAARRARPARRAGPADQPAAGRRPAGDCSSRSTARCRRRSSRRRWPTTSASTSTSARRPRSASSGRSAPAPPSRSSRSAPNPFLATVGLRVEPAPLDAGVEFRLEVELGSMPLAFFKAVEETVRETLRQGLYGWQVTDCTVTMTHSGYWARQSHAHGTFDKSMSSTAGDFRNLTPLVLMDALKQAGTEVYEPIHRFRARDPGRHVRGGRARAGTAARGPADAGSGGLVVPAGGRHPGGAGARAAATAAGADSRRRRAGERLRPLPAGRAARSRPARERIGTLWTAAAYLLRISKRI